MLAENIKCPEEYLAYSESILLKAGIFENCFKIKDYYYELQKQFINIYHTQNISTFEKWGKLLEVDAQLQILIELITITKKNLTAELGMSEEQLIRMIRHDKKSFYRELTGENTAQKPRWGLIFLSEE